MAQAICPTNFTSIPYCNEFANPRTYIRPGGGMSIMPWLLTVGLLVIHVPVAIVRVIRWESGQVWSLALAALAIVLVSLAYSSTKFNPREIYVWTPLPLLIDVGAMIQVFVLLLENPEDAERVRKTIAWWKEIVWRQIKKYGNAQSENRKSSHADSIDSALRDLPLRADEGQVGDEDVVPLPQTNPRDVRGIIILLLLSGLFAVVLIIMQLVGLGHAAQELRSPESLALNKTWCSPAFKIARQVIDINCNVYNVSKSPIGAADCIQLPGDQHRWLVWTIIGIVVGMGCEIIDALVIMRFGKRGSSKRRPWCTIVLGIAIWALFIGVSVSAADFTPFSTYDHLFLVRRSDGSICQSRVVPARLWGLILSWSEGFLSSFNDSYLPKLS